ncbi:MAG: PSD1 and planctomycete cytochrome C domain-containing protein [Pirellulaceae bacterium]|nr:PSD1 and planctomycete cytochrome C domain-containing protein [Pirellulaceae bacterium]
MLRFVMTALLFCYQFALPTLVIGDEFSSEAIDFFERKIRPALIEHCYDCHSAVADELHANLLLDSRESLLRGGESGPAVVPGDPAASLLWRAIRYDDLEMPPNGKLPAAMIADFEHWIKSGAADPRKNDSAAPVRSEIDWDQARDFWAFQKPKRSPLPSVDNSSWPRRKHDFFVVRQLETIGLTPNPPAAMRVLLRRLSFDLTGLPPTQDWLEQFSVPESDQQLHRALDQLLASPRFGERWGRVWLDLARFAEDQAHIVGNNKSLFYPNAHLYRDWLIQALNEDVPYDDFVKLQLAADLIETANPADLVALGFIGLGPKYYDRKRLQVKAEEWEDRVDTVSRGLLGLTVACARCHDHKFDPIQSEDYYALAGVFASTEMFNHALELKASPENAPKKKKGTGNSMHIVREGQPTNLHVFLRGDVNNKGPMVPRGYLQILSAENRHEFTSGSGRIELANVIASKDNPLTARVLVNRIWGQLIGRPLVDTPSNFGQLGDRPSHPTLLDDLSVRFMENDWSLKWLIREIVSSSTYRQSSLSSQAKFSKDPTNQWLSRMNRRRLEIEAWRDSLLSASQMLGSQIGGPSIAPQDPDISRRTIYARVSRFQLDPLLALFDFPDANVHSAARLETTTPIQKLFVMNHPFVLRHSERIAARITNSSSDPKERVGAIYLQLFSRLPNAEERELARQFLEHTHSDSQQAWIQYTQALIASNEMLFLD